MSLWAEMVQYGGKGAIGGAIGGAISTCFFHTPAFHKTAMKIIALGALQGAVTQAIGFGAVVYMDMGYDEIWRDIRDVLICAAGVTVATTLLLGTAKKEAVANFALSSILGHIVVLKVNH